MEFNGKKDTRLRLPAQINVDPELGVEILRRAKRRRRSKGAQVIYLLELGLQHDPEEAFHGTLRDGAHTYSQVRTVAHAGAPPRKVTHTESELKDGTSGD